MRVIRVAIKIMVKMEPVAACCVAVIWDACDDRGG
jgi:hypothetical protein